MTSVTTKTPDRLSRVPLVERRPPSVRPGLAGDAKRVLAVFAAFVVFAVMSWESFGSDGGPSFFYPASGVTVAAMMLSRRSLWPWIAFAVVIAEFLVDTIYASPPWLSAAYAAANVVEPVIGASLVLSWCGGRPDLRRRRDFALFILGACLIAPVFGALIGGTASSFNERSHWFIQTATWWSGDALGVLVMASPILLWRLQSRVLRRRPWEMALVLVLTGLLSVATFWTDFPPSILILPVLAWAGFRLDMLGAAIAGALAALLANVVSNHGRGVYIDVHLSPGGKVTVTQIYIAVIVVVAMLIAQEAAARLRAVQGQEAERRERLRLQTLSRLAHQLSAALTPEDIGEALEDQVLNDAGASALAMGLVSSDGGKLEWITASGYPQAMLDEVRGGVDLTTKTLATDVLLSGMPIEMRTASDCEAAYPHRAHWLQVTGTESIVSWPLAAGGAPFGVVQLTWSEPQPLDTAQRAYISAVATMVSQALVRAKVYADEHARAAVLHSVAQPEVHVDAAGLEYNVLYRPADTAQGLGGDWYSVMALPDRRTYLAVGDVMGHGLASVQDMAQLRSTGDAYAHLGLPPAQILSELNRFAVHQIRVEFATTLVAVFDPAHNSLAYSSAGHLPALLRRAATGEVIRLSDASGPMLGPFDDSAYVGSAVLVQPGDVLVMYTDGLVEHHDEGVMAGIAHLERAVAASPPEALLDCEWLARTVAPALHTDDVCLLVARFGPAAG